MQKPNLSAEFLHNASWDELYKTWYRAIKQETVVPIEGPWARYQHCKISRLRTDTRRNKQICFNWKGKKRHVIIHVLSYIIYTKSRKWDKGKEVSHLCHNHQCHEPTHLTLETTAVNASRKNCVGHVWSNKYKDWIPVCNHDPPCITTRILV
jgi:hypothetical protein